ncbi:hypothetical protein [Albidovulum aquaemixtae]|uniref:hypothetical protein n=1 Tax=Albidovulum aquaemixtae TaxID=1542388 RepID=UPI0015E826EF|nr:hypothetical protein [Defluviimonas aquaemixtae]
MPQICELWTTDRIDGFELQQLAEKHHIILSVSGDFKPEIRMGALFCTEPGAPCSN